MKDLVRLVGVSGVTFALGLAIGVGFALYKHKQNVAFLISTFESDLVEIPHDVSSRLKIIEAAQNGDTSWIIRTNCARIRSFAPLINPTIFSNPARRAEFTALRKRAQDKVQELERSNLCSTLK